MTSAPAAVVGVFGGSGFYAFLDDVEHVVLDTPYGAPSAPVAIGRLDDVAVAFLARHGPNHEFPPHKVNWRANAWAMRELGVRWIVGPCAVGSLKRDRHPGEMVVLDQLVDRTWGRGDTFFDNGPPTHVPFADPYCHELRAPLLAAARGAGVTVHDGGTVVVIQGPRFSTRAESAWFRGQGWDVVNMTQYPEAVLARELGICYAGLALVTDYDTGVTSSSEPVTIEEVFAVLAANVDRTRQVLRDAIPAIARLPRRCSCAALSNPAPGT